MENVFYEGQVLWSQIDANMHLRHSAYADFGAQARLNLLEKSGFSTALFYKLNLGPILFREELIYLKEVKMNDTVRVTCAMTKMRQDGSRWSYKHEIYRSDGVKAAEINVDGAWIDTLKRKITGLPPDLILQLGDIPKSDNYVEDWIPEN
ncbi:MAG: thioesterase [Chitinophagaceae bacterium]|nr:thioesterase [Chitinophagaceae bacterium]